MTFEMRRAGPSDAERIAVAHLDSIRSLGPLFYPPDVVDDWANGLTADVYLKAMDGGEIFFIAVAETSAAHAVLGFASDYRREGYPAWDVGLREGRLGATRDRLRAPRAGRSGSHRKRRDEHPCRGLSGRRGVLQGQWVRGDLPRRDTPHVRPADCVRVHGEGSRQQRATTLRYASLLFGEDEEVLPREVVVDARLLEALVLEFLLHLRLASSCDRAESERQDPRHGTRAARAARPASTPRGFAEASSAAPRTRDRRPP